VSLVRTQRYDAVAGIPGGNLKFFPTRIATERRSPTVDHPRTDYVQEAAMTSTMSRTRSSEILQARLEGLKAEHRLASAEIVPVGSGDDADRATNVDGHIRLATLENRIAEIEEELAYPPTLSPADGIGATLGDTVVIDLGDGPETFLLGTVNLASNDVQLITPASPLGQALQQARAGSTVTYQPRAGRTFTATLISIN
jgi:transcription elongation factor GreA